MKKEKFNVCWNREQDGKAIIKAVEGYVITLPEPFDKHTFGVTKVKGGWLLVEYTTGLWIVKGGKTKKEAIELAYLRLQRYTIDTLNASLKRDKWHTASINVR